MKTKRQYKTYTTEFRTEALALISEQGYTVQEAASALGITTSLLYSWKQKIEEHTNSAVNPDERAELLALRKEVKTLRMEKEILKKASVGSSDHCNKYTNILICRITNDEADIYAR